jgi:molybdate transport system substrate-binding protein
MSRRGWRAALWFVLGWALVAPLSQAAERTLTVFAAASMTEALQAVSEAYTARTHQPVRLVFAGSSALARQIEAGAPADVYVSADEAWMDELQSRGDVLAATRVDFASNSLVLVAHAGSTLSLRIAPGFALAAALGPNGRLATGDPAAVPVGRYAQAALRRLGAWDAVERRLVAADNVRTALNFVARGEAALGIVYATDVRGVAGVRVVDRFPADTHPPITYPAAAVRGSGADAAAFVSFLRGAAARALLAQAGFATPD